VEEVTGLPRESESIREVIAGAPVADTLPESPARLASGAEIAQFVALRAAACVGADYSNLALLDRAGGSFRLYHGAFLDRGIADRYTDISLDAPFPIAAAMRTGDVIVLDGLDAYRSRFPDILDDTVAAGIEATVSLPLIRADGSAIGALGFAWAEAPAFDVKLDTALRALAQLCADIVERAEQYEAEHQLVAELHRRLLGPLPQPAGLTTAALYLPAEKSASVGGDWYEGLLLDEGTLAVVVGDVVGHGLAAAADMALIRGLITAFLHDGVAIEDVFQRVSRFLLRRPGDLLATAALAIVDSTNSTIDYATAGHPPPIVVEADGAVTMLDGANSPMLGISAPHQIAGQVTFAPGARLIMYTDGLVERYDRPFTAGIEHAVSLLSALDSHVTPNELIDVLIEGLVGERRGHDDIAVVVVEHAPLRPPTHSRHPASPVSRSG
jgi:serine phosphatase RsbU (regulator of sigma subunit)